MTVVNIECPSCGHDEARPYAALALTGVFKCLECSTVFEEDEGEFEVQQIKQRRANKPIRFYDDD